MNRNFKISFCTVVRNRLHHLKSTLPKNIEDNLDYDNAQFVILDYNSNDGVSQWIQSELSTFINSGKLVYYYTPEPEYFNRSHSRNMLFKLSEGEIVCNVDADNYVGSGFAEYINSEFNGNYNLFLSTYSEDARNVQKDVIGRICFKKSDFYLIGGLDERMSSYGFEDYDFINRLKLSGLENKIIADFNFLKAISHSNEERINEEKSYKTFYKLYISHINFSKTDIIVLFKTGEFHFGRIIDYKALYSTDFFIQRKYSDLEYEFGLEKGNWDYGVWEEKDNCLFLSYSANSSKCLIMSQNYLQIGTKRFTEIHEKELITNFLLFHSEFGNRNLLKMKAKEFTTNNEIDKCGKGFVYRNFDYKKIII